MGPVFVRFVSSVEGRLVSRWDAPQSFIGARWHSPEETKETGQRVAWDTDAVVPLTDAFCARFDKELRCALRDGDLLERTEEDYKAWLVVEAQRDAAAYPPPAVEPVVTAPPEAQGQATLVDAGGPGTVPGTVEETLPSTRAGGEQLGGFLPRSGDEQELPDTFERSPAPKASKPVRR